jgi:hypothetical protein
MEFFGLLMWVLVLAFYFIPTIVGYINHQPNVQAIAVVNIFLGWTLVGWVVALAWAFAAQKAISEAPATVACPMCAEPVLPQAIKCKHCGADLSHATA